MHTCFTQWNAFVALPGEDATYETLIQRFEDPGFNLVSRLIDDPSDAAHVVQKVFRKVFRNVGTFRNEGTLKIWIYRIVVSEAQNGRRWFGRRRREVRQASIEAALRTMNAKLRATLLLREIEGLSYEEITEILDVSPDTAKSHILLGRDALTRQMAGCLNPSSTLDWYAQSVD
jgi:RNA polymerase sigma-70 factor (ECF subfamily)